MLLEFCLGSLFLAVIFFFLAIEKLLNSEHHYIKGRLLKYTTQLKSRSVKVDKGRRNFGRAFIRRGGQLFSPFKLSEHVEKKLVRLDLPLRGEEFLFLNLVISLAALLLLRLFTGNLVLLILGGLLFFILPWIYLEQMQQKRLNQLNNQLGDALVVMANSLRAGYSFLQAMEMVAKEIPPPITVDFGRALREMQLGTTTEAALSNLSQRVGSEDLDLVITTLLIQRQIGGNLSEILNNIAETIRERVRIKREIKTLTAQGRISGLIIGLLPLVLLALLFLVNPPYIAVLFTEPLGLFLLGGAVCGELLGIVLIRRIVDIKV